MTTKRETGGASGLVYHKELLLDDCPSPLGAAPAMANPNPLHGAVRALQALLKQESKHEAADSKRIDPFVDARDATEDSAEVLWDSVASGKGEAKKPSCRRAQVVQAQQALTAAVEGILRSLEDVAPEDLPLAERAGGDILPQEAEVKMLRAEEENLQQQLQSLLQELQAVQEAMPKEEPSQDVSAEIALLGCFQEVAVKHRALFFPEGQEPLSRDHEVVASYIADNLHASS
mmetsp:Transcript_54296/g.111992  ORF Transcript_54296/g.111992 Transcript_54296/m.111992 type:complete len:232 (+) Transcript_54296:76-771(+)